MDGLLDSGRGFLKICLTMERKHRPVGSSPQKKKNTQKKFKDDGVKRLIILGLIEDVPETYENVKTLMELVGVNKLSFATSLAMDLKMVNTLCGKRQLYNPFCKSLTS